MTTQEQILETIELLGLEGPEAEEITDRLDEVDFVVELLRDIESDY